MKVRGIPLTPTQRLERFWHLWAIAETAEAEGRVVSFDCIDWREVCPDCGLEDELGGSSVVAWGFAEHKADCPRVGTCGQCVPYLDPPFHPEPPPAERGDFLTWLSAHRKEHAKELEGSTA